MLGQTLPDYLSDNRFYALIVTSGPFSLNLFQCIREVLFACAVVRPAPLLGRACTCYRCIRTDFLPSPFAPLTQRVGCPLLPYAVQNL